MTGAVLRRALWRAAFALAGGLRTTGEVPTGPCVVVANHSSHADTAALLATLPAGRSPRPAAAADYWFCNPWRRFVAKALVAAVPVQRDGGGYASLRDAALPHLKGGGVVFMYPEGTRSTDGTVGTWHSGAVRLAREAGVPVVTAGLVGTADVLPKHGRLRRRAVEVRYGGAHEPDGTSPEALRSEVCDLLEEGPAREATSPTWEKVAGVVRSRAFLPLMLAWGFAEALSWPIIAEMSLVLFAAAVPRRVLPGAAALATGSVLGVAAHTYLAAKGWTFPAPLTTSRMFETAAGHLAAGPGGIWNQLGNGIPVKVYAAEAGRAGTDSGAFLLQVAGERGTRILVVGAVVAALSRILRPWTRRVYGWYLLLVSVTFTLLLQQVIAQWS